MVIVLNGRKKAKEIRQKIKKKVQLLRDQKKAIPHFTIIGFSHDRSFDSYAQSIMRQAMKPAQSEFKDPDVPIQDFLVSYTLLHQDATKKDLEHTIDLANENEKTHGILLQSSLPQDFDPDNIRKRIQPKKDIDGVRPDTLEKMAQGAEYFVPATAKGIYVLLQSYNIEIEGKNVVIIGRGNVGAPTRILFERYGAHVFVCHSQTTDLKKHTKEADILISATPKIYIVTGDMIKDGATVIDAGYEVIDNKVYGNVDFDSVKNVAGFITKPVGGIGPMTVVSLLENVLSAYHLQTQDQ